MHRMVLPWNRRLSLEKEALRCAKDDGYTHHDGLLGFSEAYPGHSRVGFDRLRQRTMESDHDQGLRWKSWTRLMAAVVVILFKRPLFSTRVAPVVPGAVISSLCHVQYMPSRIQSGDIRKRNGHPFFYRVFYHRCPSDLLSPPSAPPKYLSKSPIACLYPCRSSSRVQVFLEGTARGLRAAKALLPVGAPGVGSLQRANPLWNDATSSSSSPPLGGAADGSSSTPVSPAVSSSSPLSTPPDDAGGFVGRRYSMVGADDLCVPGTGISVLGSSGVPLRHGQRRSMSFGSSDDSPSHGAAGGVGVSGRGSGLGGGGWGASGGSGNGGSGASWPLSYVTNVG